MNKEFSVGAVVFRRENDGISFLMIYSSRNKNWGFPKGHIEPGETEQETLSREIQEETGLSDLELEENFREEDIYESDSNRGPFKGQKIEKHSIYYLCKSRGGTVKLDEAEIGDFKWVRPNEAVDLLTFESSKNILRKAINFVKAASC
jgi:bis(5'-nucleosidyl)-tetraphosphatase